MSNTYWPEDNSEQMYILGSSQHSLAAIITMCKDKWPETDFNDLVFESEYIQVRGIGYDLHDPSDYTEFIIISRVPQTT